MTPLLQRSGLILVVAGLLMGCAESADYEPPRLPPPPPPAPAAEPAATPEPYTQEAAPPPPSQAQAQSYGSEQPGTSMPPSPPPPPPDSAAPSAPSPPVGQAPSPPVGQAPSPPVGQAPSPPVGQVEQPSAPLVYSYPTGQWVYLSGRGWVWVPAGASTVEADGVPYVYLYTPSYGWTWYLSPWGWGPYRYGVWVRHPWHPAGWHGYWVAHPRVVVRLGPRGYYGHYRRR